MQASSRPSVSPASPSVAPSHESPSAPGPADPAPMPAGEPKELLAGGELGLYDYSLAGDPKIARRAVVLVPRHLAPGVRVPLLIALHGLAETVDEASGAYAWVRRYGIAEGYAHLRAPETITVEGLGKMVTAERAADLRASLADHPFKGLVIACPYTPNIWKAAAFDATLDGYADWIFDTLVPRLRKETPVVRGDAHVGLDGVSLGGYVSLAVGVRKMSRIGALGCVQAAIATADADRWAERLGRAFESAGPRPLHLLTSDRDAFRAPVEALDRALSRRGVSHTFRLAVGPHDQPFLRGPGSVEMLHWHARALVA